MLSLQDIHLTYNKDLPLEQVVFDGLNIEVHRGEFVSVIGSNGIGKSTLVKIITGEVRPTSGKVIIDGRDCTSLDIVARSKLVSTVFQDPLRGVAPELSVLENLVFAQKRGKLRTLSIAIGQDEREYADRLSVLNMGLEDKLHCKAKSLSGGQRQALSMLMATLCPARLLILDEHTSSLNPQTADMLMELTYKIVQEHNITTLMITHNMRHTSYCDHRMTIEDGKLKLLDKYTSCVLCGGS